jgi:NADPH:quinone reductase-like Zn-dependent oxidoreductase
VGVNFKDLMSLLGRASAKDLGSEFAGIVTAVGESVKNVSPGDRVVVAYVDGFRTHARVPWQAVYRLPDGISFGSAASVPTAFRTAYFCLFHLARLQKSESVLIHRASGGTGQAAVQLAKLIGATVYVTVGSEAKKRLLMKHYELPEQHILYSRDSSFGIAIKRLTNNRGVDVLLNSLSGELLETSWDIIAPCGRFIEIGLGDAYSQQHLQMFNFSKGVSFMAFNLTNFMTPEFWPAHIILMQSVWDLLEEGKIHPPQPLQLFPVEKIEDAFRLLNSGNSSGKIVIEIERTHIVPVRCMHGINFIGNLADLLQTVTPYLSTFQLETEATYVVTGGLGGIGLKIAQWLCSKGARNLVLVSRSGLSCNTDAQAIVSTLKASGVRVECPAIDIANRELMEEYFTNRPSKLPPIRGYIQSAMALRDATLANMTIDDWHQPL